MTLRVRPERETPLRSLDIELHAASGKQAVWLTFATSSAVTPQPFRSSLNPMRYLLCFLLLLPAWAETLPVVQVEHQPFSAQVARLLEALELLGAPLPPAET